MKQEAEAAKERGESTFKHVFGINREFFFNNILINLLIIWNELIDNIIEVFVEIDCHVKYAPPASSKATLEDTQALGSSFQPIDVGVKGFYVALDKN